MNAISLLLANTRHHPTIIISITTNNEFRPDSRTCGVFFCFFTLVFLFLGASIIGNARHILKTTARRCQQVVANNKLKQTIDTRRLVVKQVDAKLDAVWHNDLIPFEQADIEVPNHSVDMSSWE